jgi:hypothetical protein
MGLRGLKVELNGEKILKKRKENRREEREIMTVSESKKERRVRERKTKETRLRNERGNL